MTSLAPPSDDVASGPSRLTGERLPRSPRFVWLFLVAIAYVPSLLTAPGKVAADTKAYLYLDPSKLLSSAWSMWNPDVAMGTVTHQNIGYLFPMGPYYWLIHALSIPMWLGQRFWMGTLFFAAASGVYVLCRLFKFSWAGSLAAAIAYMTTPYVIDYITRISAITMPWAALGWMMVVVILAVRRGGWRYPAWFALIIALVGGVNATSILFVGLAPALWLIYALLVTRETTVRAILSAVVKIAILTLLVSLWWIAGLWAEGAYGINILKYTETIPTVTSTSLASEVLRGLGYWYFYGRDASTPWTEAAGSYLRSFPVIVVSFAVPATALLSSFAVRWRYRAFAIWLVLIGVIFAVAAYPLTSPTPFGTALRSVAEGSTVGLAMRSSNRVLPVMVLGLALLLGSFVTAIARSRRAVGLWVTIGAVVLSLANLLPLFSGSLVPSNESRPSTLPHYITSAANYLNSHNLGTRVFIVPGEDFASYSWGTTADSIWPGLLNRPVVQRQAVVQGEPASADMLRAIDEAVQDGNVDPAALAPMSRLMSAGDVMLESDIAFNRYGLTNPKVLWNRTFVPTPAGLEPPVTFGSPAVVAAIPARLYDEGLLALPPGSPTPAPLTVFPVTGTRSVVRAEAETTPLVIAGNGNGIVSAASSGLLSGDPTILYSASIPANSALLSNVMSNDATLVLTDTNARELDSWGTLHGTYGYIMTANERPLVNQPSEATLPLFPGAPTSTQTVAVYAGVDSIQATSYGNPINNDISSQPANAFDGRDTTAWREGAFQSAIGGRLVLNVGHPYSVDTLTFVQPQSGVRTRHITKITVTFDGKAPLHISLGPASLSSPGQVVTFPARVFSTMSIRVDATNMDHVGDVSAANAVGFAEVNVPGLTPIRWALRMPTDLLQKAGTSSLNHRLVILANRLLISDHRLARLFTLPTARTFAFTGQARLDENATDSQINDVVGRTGPTAHPVLPPGSAGDAYVTAADSSSRLAGTTGSWEALDANPLTAWVPALGHQRGQWISVGLNKSVTVDHLNLVVINDGHHSIPTSLTISTPTSTETVPVPAMRPAIGAPAGTTQAVTVALTMPVTATSFKVTVAGTVSPAIIDYIDGGPKSLPVGIAELGLPGVVAPLTPPTISTTCAADLLVLDGQPVAATVSGSTSDALNNKPLTLSACGSSSQGLAMATGSHEIDSVQSTSTRWTVDTLAMGSDGGGAPLALTGANQFALPAPQRATEVTITSQARTEIHGTLLGNGAPGWLVLGQSQSKGWRLSVDGHAVGTTSTLIDGFANGWQLPTIPVGKTVSITLVWQPQSTIDTAIYLSAAGLFGVLCILVIPPLRRRRRTEAPRPRTSVRDQITGVDVDNADPTTPVLDSPRTHRGGMPKMVAVAVATIVAMVFCAVFFSPLAACVIGPLAVVTLLVKRGRTILVAATVIALAVAVADVVRGAHLHPWNILWPLNFNLASQAVWFALMLLATDSLVDLATGGARIPSDSTDPSGTEPPRDGSLVPVPSTPEPPSDPSTPDELQVESGASASSIGHGDVTSPVPVSAAPAEAPAVAAVTASAAAARIAARSSADDETLMGATPTGLRRSYELFKAFRVEQSDPDLFYRTLAEDTAIQLAGFAPLFNRLVLDIGGGPGYFSEAFTERGARCILIEPEAKPVEIRDHNQPFHSVKERHDYAVLPGRLFQEKAIAGDGMRLPFADGIADITFSSNVLEHVPDPRAFIEESIRVTKPNGTIYLSFTVWHSPWGGHETSPWHFLGGARAAKRYERKHGRPPGNLFGTSLFAYHVGDVLKIIKAQPNLAKVTALPRYYPDWMRWVVKVPLVRELVTWNLLVVMRKDIDRPTRSSA